MPEGHTIHRLARDQRPTLVGRAVHVWSPQGRFKKESKRIDGGVVDLIEPRGKHLLYHFESGVIWHVHLGLYGKFRPFQGQEPEPRGQVRVSMSSEIGGFHLVGPNTCELINDDELHTLRSRLGPDPLAGDSPESFVERVVNSRAAIGSLLLDQSVIAGVGNIFRADALFLEGIHPTTRGVDLSQAQVSRLWSRLKQLLEVGLKHNKIITADPKVVGKPRSRMSKSERLLIYKAERCPSCRSEVESFTIAARRIDACPRCQNIEFRKGRREKQGRPS